MFEFLKDNTEMKINENLKNEIETELSKAFGDISHDVLIIKLHG